MSAMFKWITDRQTHNWWHIHIYQLSFVHHKLLVTAGKPNYIEYLTSNFSLTVLENYSVIFTLKQSVFMTNYIWNIWDKNEENNSGNSIQNVLSMTFIWIDERIKLPTIKKYLLYWTINWWHGERCGNGFFLCASAVFHLWRQCSQGPQKITCNIKREKSSSVQIWWIGGKCGIGFLHCWFSGTLLWCRSTISKMNVTCSIKRNIICK